MTRNYDFTLPAAGVSYNLWDLIVAKYPQFDFMMANTPYVPSMVSEFQVQSDLNTNGGMTITLTDKQGLGGINLSVGQADLERSSVNDIDLKNKVFVTDTNGALIHVRLRAN